MAGDLASPAPFLTMIRKRGVQTPSLPSATEKRRRLRQFHKLIASAPKLDFLFAIYSIHQIQNGKSGVRGYFLDLPNEAKKTDQRSEFYFQPWVLETLANEILSVPWEPKLRDGATRTLNARSFAALSRAYNLLHKAENASDGPVLRRVGVLTQINRLAKRQFEWQRHFSTVSRLARFHSIYRTEASIAYFRQKYGLDFDTFTEGSFAIYSMLLGSNPVVRTDIDLSPIDIRPTDVEKIVEILSLTVDSAQERASSLRQGFNHLGYAPSIFRLFPLITFTQSRHKYAMSPIPDLLFYRITEGLFYDFVENSTLRREFAQKSGNIRNEFDDNPVW